MTTNLAEASGLFKTSACVGVALSILAVILTDTADSYFDLGLHPEVSMLALIWTFSWTLPTFLYLMYHRITLPLPTWLTFGHPIEFGGQAPNICGDPYLALEVNGDGGFPCLPSSFKTWLFDVAGPGGWKYLFQPNAKIMMALFFLVYNIAMLVAMVVILRKPRYDKAKQTERRCRRCKHWEYGVESSELGDYEKQ